MHGVRQLGPKDVFASAPGGSDSMVSEKLAPPVRLPGTQSQLGVHEAQPATNRALATAHTRTIGIIFKTASPFAPRLPARADHTGLAFPVQPEFKPISRCAIARIFPKLLRYQIL